MKAGVKVISDVIDSGYRITHSPPRVFCPGFCGPLPISKLAQCAVEICTK